VGLLLRFRFPPAGGPEQIKTNQAMQYDFGMIGIGVMGSNLLLNMADRGFAVMGFDLKEERVKALEAAAAPGTTVKGTTDVATLVAALRPPRRLMMLVPAGAPVDAVIQNLLPHLEQGDILIDGGNSYYRDTLRRVEQLKGEGIHFFGMGVSGGEAGARYGPSLMPGGDTEAYQYLKPVLEAIAARAGDVPCVAYMGSGAAGHYVKMVHNGIEYALMQLISEAYDLLRRSGYGNEALQEVFAAWNKGPLQSFLIEITADVFRTRDDIDPSRWLVDQILDQAGSKGTGKWTSQEALDLPLPVPTIDAAVAARNLSAYREQRQEAAALRKKEPGALKPDKAFLSDLEAALTYSFVVAYAQGLALLAKASEVHGMGIPLPSVVQVWRAGCIIRSALLGTFSEAFEREPSLPNLLLDPGVAALLEEKEAALRRTLGIAIGAGVPVSALSSALAYADAFRSARLPTNLIQAQRDYFGAHTYQRIDHEGVFHTEWNSNRE
jgi:6-phosphogluconate dehydrogenase